MMYVTDGGFPHGHLPHRALWPVPGWVAVLTVMALAIGWWGRLLRSRKCIITTPSWRWHRPAPPPRPLRLPKHKRRKPRLLRPTTTARRQTADEGHHGAARPSRSHPALSRSVAFRACTLIAATRPVSTIPAKPITRESNRAELVFGRKVTIADREPCHEGEVEGLVDPPTLYAPDCQPGPNHNQEDSGKDWPDHTKLLGERHKEETPHLPCLWCVACFCRHYLQPFC